MLINVFRIVRKITGRGVWLGLELNSAGKWISRARFEYPWSRDSEACSMNAAQKIKRGAVLLEALGRGVMVTPIKMSLIRQRKIWFLKGADVFSGPVEKRKIKALLNLKGVGKCLLASGNTNISEGAQWQDHKYPCFDHSNTHAHTPLTRHAFSFQFQLIYLCQIQTSAWRHVTHFLCYKTQMVHFESILHKIMKNKCAIMMNKSKTKSSFTPAIWDPFTQIYINS